MKNLVSIFFITFTLSLKIKQYLLKIKKLLKKATHRPYFMDDLSNYNNLLYSYIFIYCNLKLCSEASHSHFSQEVI